MAVASCRVSISDHLFCIVEPELDRGPSVAGKVSFQGFTLLVLRSSPSFLVQQVHGAHVPTGTPETRCGSCLT